MHSFINYKDINNKNLLKIKLNYLDNIKSFSNMFDKCSSLLAIKIFSHFDTININNMSWMFSNCESLKELPDISMLKIWKECFLIVNH